MRSKTPTVAVGARSRPTLAPRVPRRAIRAVTEGLALERLADGRLRARVRHEARILATTIQAGVDAVAVDVGQTETARTWDNFGSFAFGLFNSVILKGEAKAINYCQLRPAGLVFNYNIPPPKTKRSWTENRWEKELTLVAVDVGIARVVFRTGTLGLVSGYGADGVSGARIGNRARIDTLPISAALAIRTVAVGTTSWRFHWN